MSPVRSVLLFALVATALGARVDRARAQCPPLGGFGGPVGFGEGVVPRGDDDPSVLVDLGDAFPDGLGFFGATFSDVYININGNLTLGEASATYTAFAFPSPAPTPPAEQVRRIAPFFSDVDTRHELGDHNAIYWHVDVPGRRLVVTWYEVERFNVDASLGVNTFQAILTARPDLGPGDFDVEYRYDEVHWVRTSTSPPAQIGFDANDGVNYASHPLSLTDAVADIETVTSNHASDCTTGSFAYYIRSSCGNDQVDAVAQEECDPLGADPGCSSLCTVTPGFACTHVDGQPSVCAAGCGDGLFDPTVEECDDNNPDPGDGCSNLCRVEPGATCDTDVEPSACDNSCDDDLDCVGAAFCGDDARCHPKRPIAQPCARDGMCASDACADGVCCGSPCDEGCGTCAAPGSVGSCTAVAAGSEGAACGGFLCDGASPACPTTCADDDGCAAASHCADGGACEADLAAGAACDREAMCDSALCVDGTCCGAPCDGACERCDLEGHAGACTPLPDGTLEAACGDYACDGVSGQCPTSCASDDDCVADHYCDGQGACLPDLGPGASCERDAQCGARVCTVGVCCGVACEGACETCLADPGTCTPLGDGAAVASCAPLLCDGTGGGCPTTCAGDADCLATHFCEGGACLPDRGAGEGCARAAECATGTTCVDEVCCTSSCAGACERCDAPGAEGDCAPLPDGTFVAACGVYACDGALGECPATCAGDADCAADHFCGDEGACLPDGDAAAVCARDSQCTTGVCADGVCCDGRCEGGCERCDLPGDEGACTPVADGTLVSPCGAYACDGASGACPASCAGDDDCRADHFCDGAACVPDRAAGAGCERTAQCAAGTCVDDVCCTLPCDGPCGRCGLVTPGACGFFGDGTFVDGCGAFACDGQGAVCPTTCASDDDCAASHFCDDEGACAPDLALASACGRDGQCTSGACADGVCCDGRCDGACEACDLEGAAGACTPVPDGTVANVCGGTLCDGVDGACPTSCADDGDCGASHYCDDGVCVLDEPPGGACDRKAQCGEGHCVDRVCCFTTCEGPCDRCDGASPGACEPVAAGTFVAACGALACDGVGGGCPAACADDAGCLADHFCEGGSCLPDRAPGGACDRVGQCALGLCVDGVCCDAACDGGCDRCDGAAPGTCAPLADGVAGVGCGPYLCGGAAACPATCGGDLDCAADHFCEGGACLPDRPTGQACDRVAQCASGSCADGFCCDEACDGACERCDGAAPGTCAPVADGTLVAACDPYACAGAPGCPASCASDADCVADHHCDDAGACAPDAAPGTACDDAAMCASGTCSDGVCCDWPCDGACERCDLEVARGTCTLLGDGALVEACGVYACDGLAGRCPTTCASDADCAGDHFCDGQGACRPDQADGVACARASQCASGACADGLCCDAPCEGACDRCDLPAAGGACTPVADGIEERACGAYLCGGGPACPTTCAGDGDCVSGFVCEAGSCVEEADDGAACARDAACSSGHCVGGLCCSAACDGPCEACDLDGLEGRCSPLPLGAPREACGVYHCDGEGGGCPVSCDSDDVCVDGAWCDDAACVATLPDGATCARDRACASGFCDDLLCITLAIDEPLDGAITNDATPEIRGRAPRGATVRLTLGVSTVTVVASSSGEWVHVPTGLLPEGPITIVATLGEAEVAIDITIDTRAPGITIQSPLAGTIRPEPTVTVRGTTEPELPVEVVIGALSRAANAGVDGVWSVDFVGLADGPHTAIASAADLAGNRSEAQVGFTVDSLAPTIEILSPVQGALTNVAEVVVGGRGKPSSDLTLSHDGRTLEGAVDAAGDWTIALGEVADGTWTDRVTITDATGRQADDEVTYTIDTLPPAVAVTLPEADARLVAREVVITGTSEPGAELEVWLDGVPLGTLEVAASGDWTASADQLEVGRHLIEVDARDAAGNTTRVPRFFHVDESRAHLVGGSSCAGGGAGLVGLVALALAALELARRRARGGGR
ncbi:MAG: hypothetical protein IT385_18830 [Deltaproteobacteria bacterium]|nr:hypothetical protein [Deltaproteobacteria bacterium]